MLDEILKAIWAVFLPSMVKFIFGPIGGFTAQLHILTTAIGTVCGSMTSVITFAYFGKFMREKILDRFFKKKKPDVLPNKKWASIFSKYGLSGIAFLTPLLLTPIGGTLLAVGFGSPKEKIIFYMLVSSIIWAIVLTIVVYFFGHKALPEFVK